MNGGHAPLDERPEPGVPLDEDLRYQRGNPAPPVVLPRIWVRVAVASVATAVVVALLAAFGGTLLEVLESSFRLSGEEYLLLHVVSLGVAVGTGLLFRRLMRGPEDEPEEGEMELDPYEAAYLSGGADEAARAALAALYARASMRLDIENRKFVAQGLMRPDTHPFETRVHRAAGGGSGLREIVTRGGDELLGPLRSRGFVVAAGREALGRVIPALAVGMVGLMGLHRLMVGPDRERPMGFLIMALLATAPAAIGFAACALHRTVNGERALGHLRNYWAQVLFGLCWLMVSLDCEGFLVVALLATAAAELAFAACALRRTVKGKRALEKLRGRHSRLRQRAAASEVAMAVALFGLDALTTTPYEKFKEMLLPPPLADGGGGE